MGNKRRNMARREEDYLFGGETHFARWLDSVKRVINSLGDWFW